jgi:hypothetical protein
LVTLFSSSLLDYFISMSFFNNLDYNLAKKEVGLCYKLLSNEVFALSDGVYIFVIIWALKGSSIIFPLFLISVIPSVGLLMILCYWLVGWLILYWLMAGLVNFFWLLRSFIGVAAIFLGLLLVDFLDLYWYLFGVPKSESLKLIGTYIESLSGFF